MKSSAYQLDYCSDHLRALKRKFQEFEHGGIVLDSEQVQQLVDQLEETIAMALSLEFTISNAEWNRRAAADRDRMMTGETAVVLDAFRDDPKIVPFPRRH